MHGHLNVTFVQGHVKCVPDWTKILKKRFIGATIMPSMSKIFKEYMDYMERRPQCYSSLSGHRPVFPGFQFLRFQLLTDKFIHVCSECFLLRISFRSS